MLAYLYTQALDWSFYLKFVLRVLCRINYAFFFFGLIDSSLIPSRFWKLILLRTRWWKDCTTSGLGNPVQKRLEGTCTQDTTLFLKVSLRSCTTGEDFVTFNPVPDGNFSLLSLLECMFSAMEHRCESFAPMETVFCKETNFDRVKRELVFQENYLWSHRSLMYMLSIRD